MDNCVKLPLHACHMLLKPCMSKHAPQFRIVVDVTGVQVVSDRPFEECCILRNNRQSTSEIQKANVGGVQTIDTALALARSGEHRPGVRVTHLILPAVGSMILNNAKVRDDFPAPVRPTTPIFSLALMSSVMSLSTGSRPSRYRVE